MEPSKHMIWVYCDYCYGAGEFGDYCWLDGLIYYEDCPACDGTGGSYMVIEIAKTKEDNDEQLPTVG